MPLTENSDGTLWIKIDDLSEVAGVQEKLTTLGVPIAALSPDPGCDEPVTEVRWGDIYPEIVPRNGPEPGIIVDPARIPDGHTLLLAVQPYDRPVQDRKTVTVLRLIKGPRPQRFGPVLGRTPPPPPGYTPAKPPSRR